MEPLPSKEPVRCDQKSINPGEICGRNDIPVDSSPKEIDIFDEETEKSINQMIARCMKLFDNCGMPIEDHSGPKTSNSDKTETEHFETATGFTKRPLNVKPEVNELLLSSNESKKVSPQNIPGEPVSKVNKSSILDGAMGITPFFSNSSEKGSSYQSIQDEPDSIANKSSILLGSNGAMGITPMKYFEQPAISNSVPEKKKPRAGLIKLPPLSPEVQQKWVKPRQKPTSPERIVVKQKEMKLKAKPNKLLTVENQSKQPVLKQATLDNCSAPEKQDLGATGSSIENNEHVQEAQGAGSLSSRYVDTHHLRLKKVDKPKDFLDKPNQIPQVHVTSPSRIQNKKDTFVLPENKVKKASTARAEVKEKKRATSAGNLQSLGSRSSNQPQTKRSVTPVPKNALVKETETIEVNGKSYQLLKKLGTGGSCIVYEVLDPLTNLVLALKAVNLANTDQQSRETFLNEVKLLKSLQGSESVITMHDFEHNEQKDFLYVTMEKGDTDLQNIIKSRKSSGRIPEEMIRFYWGEMLRAVEHIHGAGIIHSDLKPANFLLVGGRLKLIDFGIASALSNDMTSVLKDSKVGTFNFMSPEALEDCSPPDGSEKGTCIKVGPKSDVWSLGCILYSMVYGKTPFQHIPQLYAKLRAICSDKYNIEFQDCNDPDLLDCMRKCLVRNVKKRTSVKELLQHRYLNVTQREKNKSEDPNRPEEIQNLMKKLAEYTPNTLHKLVSKLALGSEVPESQKLNLEEESPNPKN